MKPIFKSKTILFNMLVAIAACHPAAQAIVAADPAVAVSALAAANFLLRLVTKDKVALFPAEG